MELKVIDKKKYDILLRSIYDLITIMISFIVHLIKKMCYFYH